MVSSFLMSKILIIEDNREIAHGIKMTFSSSDTTLCHSIKEAKRILTSEKFNIIILDLNLPDGDGLDFQNNFLSDLNIPVVMLTARDLDRDELAGLNAGAEDYITKPFSPAVLRKRVEKILTRDQHTPSKILKSGDITVDLEQKLAKKKNTMLSLSITEFNLLALLIKNRDRILLKEIILEKIWANDPVNDNTLSVNIKRVRNKIEDDPKNPIYIKTIHGIGYSWQDQQC